MTGHRSCRPAALALSAPAALAVLRLPGASAEEAVQCFVDGMAYDSTALAPNAGYVTSPEECQEKCQASSWCSFFTYKQGLGGAPLGGCWNVGSGAKLETQDGATSGPQQCPTPAPTPPPTPPPTPAPTLPPTLPPALPVTTAPPSDGIAWVQNITGTANWTLPRVDVEGSEKWFREPEHWVLAGVLGFVVLAFVLMLLACCCCHPKEKDPVKKKEKKKKLQNHPLVAQQQARTVVPTNTQEEERDGPTPMVAATPSPSFSESQPLLRVPGLTPPVLPQLVLPPVQQSPDPLVPPLEVPFQPLRVPSVSANPGGEQEEVAQLPLQAQPGLVAASPPGSFMVQPGSFVSAMPPSAFGSFRYA